MGALKGTVHYETRGAIALLTIDNPPVNPLSSGVRQGLCDGVARALNDNTIQAVVVTGAGRAFIAGADISEFGAAATAGPSLHETLADIENSGKPVVAAINGTAFGGGLEVALCCHYRAIAPAASVGLPEVKLGLLPGAGGTQRLPYLIGAEAALQFMLTGAPAGATKAKALGIVDAVVDGDDFLEGALDYTRELISSGAPSRRIRDQNDVAKADRQRPEIFQAARDMATKRMRGQFAPEQIIQCVEAAVHSDDFDAGIATERKLFVECMEHPQREALIHVFFSERLCNKIPDVPKDTAKRPIAAGAVVGCGTMGGGIAMNFANAGLPVTVLETSQEALDRGLEVIRKNYERTAKRGGLTAEQVAERMALITATLRYEDLADADVVIEAVFENLELKEQIFGTLDKVMKPGAILASNTSALDIDRIAAATSRPQDVIGLHFFSPANVMRLLEVVRGQATGKDVIATAMSLGKSLNKVAVLAGNCQGFIGNRMLGKYIEQAGELMIDGAAPWDIDRALYDFGMNMGPFAMKDLVGLDLGWRARKMAGVRPEDASPAERVADGLCEMERFGQKSGRGYYIYQEGARQGTPDPEVLPLIQEVAAALGRQQHSFSDEEILKRCLYPLINEGARVLEEGIALRASDIDIAFVNGYGFPAHRGGPMFWADKVGLDNILRDLLDWQQRDGDAWAPAPLLKRLAEEGKGFASLS